MDAKFLQLSNYLGCKKFLMGNAVTVADFALYDVLKWHHALDGHLVSKCKLNSGIFPISKVISQKCLFSDGNIMEYIDRFECLPKIQSFLKSSKHFKAFFPPFAKWGNGIDNPITFQVKHVECNPCKSES